MATLGFFLPPALKKQLDYLVTNLTTTAVSRISLLDILLPRIHNHKLYLWAIIVAKRYSFSPATKAGFFLTIFPLYLQYIINLNDSRSYDLRSIPRFSLIIAQFTQSTTI